MDRGRAKAVVVAPNWLGDAVMSLRAIGVLGAASGVRLAVMTGPYVARVYWGIHGVEELVVDARTGRLGRTRDRARSLSAYAADAALVLPPSFSSALAPFLARTRVRVGLATDARTPLLTDASPPPPRTHHMSDSFVALARRLAERLERKPTDDPRTPRLRVTDPEREAIAERLRVWGIPPGGYAVVVPGAAYGPTKRWPWERYRALCARLSRDIPVLVAGSPADDGLCARVADGLPGVVNAAGRTSLGEFFAVVERARVLVANDSGAPHVAASLEVPVVVLFGSTSPAWTAPRGENVQVLQHWVHCNPCFRRTCPTELECFHGIDVETVWARTRAVLEAAPAFSRVAPFGAVE